MSRDWDYTASNPRGVGSGPLIHEPLTFAGWFNLESALLGQTIVSEGSTANPDGRYEYYRLGIFSADATTGNVDLRIGTWPTGSKSSQVIAVQSTLNLTSSDFGVWHHAAGSVINSSTTWYDLAVYTDGGNKGTTSSIMGKDPTINTLSVGEWVTEAAVGGQWTMNGLVAEVGIWNVVLTDNEIKTLAAGVSPIRVRPVSLQRYWPIYGDVDPEPDFSGTGDTLVIQGNPEPAQSDHAPVGPPFGWT